MDKIGTTRPLGLSAVTFIAIGFMIGGGVFVFTGIVLNISGKALPLAYALAGIPVFISMLPLVMLGAAIPLTGAHYQYSSRMVSPLAAFSAIWVYALASFFGQIPLYAISCASYAGFYIHGMSPQVMAAVILTLFYVVNLLGIRAAAFVQGIMVLILLSALLLYSFRGISLMPPETVSSIFESANGKLLPGTALLTFTYLGANGIIELGGDIRNPGRVIPWSFAIAFTVVTVVYIMMAVATIGAPAKQIQAGQDTLISVCRAILSKYEIAYFVFGGAILAIVTTLNALFIVGTKSLLMIIEDGLLPKFLGVQSKIFKTPYVLLSLIWLAGLIGIFSDLEITTLASYASLGGLLIFFPVQIAALMLPVLHPEQYRMSPFRLKGFFFWFCPIVGMAMILFFSLVILIDLKSPQKIFIFVVFILSGIIYFYARKRWLSSRGTGLDRTFRKNGFDH